MDALFEVGLSVTVWLQAAFGQFDGLLRLVSALGRFEMYLVLVLLIYWCVDKMRGKHLAYLLIVGGTVVAVLKHLLRPPRPFWLNPELALGEFGEGYGFPSGQTFFAVVMFAFICIWLTHNRFVVGGSIFFVLLTILSRLYLGDHFPHDVLGGVLIGGIALVAYWVWMERYHEPFSQRIMGQRFWLAVLLPVGLFLFYVVALYFLPFSATLRPNGERFSYAAEVASYEDVVFSLAVWLGLGIGLIFERSRVRFRVDGSRQMRTGRYLLGVLLVLGLQFGLRALFARAWPVESGLVFALVLRFVRYYLVGILAVYYVPMLFVYIGLADAEPAQQITGSLNLLKQTDSAE